MKFLYDKIGWIVHYRGFGWLTNFFERVRRKHYS